MRQAPALRIGGCGQVDLPKRTIDYRIEPKAAKTLEITAGQIRAARALVGWISGRSPRQPPCEFGMACALPTVHPAPISNATYSPVNTGRRFSLNARMPSW